MSIPIGIVFAKAGWLAWENVLRYDVLNSKIYLLGIAFIVFSTTAGYGLIEGGMVNPRNSASVLYKTLLNFVVTGFAFWLSGWSLSFSHDGNDIASSTEAVLQDFRLEDNGRFLFLIASLTLGTTMMGSMTAGRLRLSVHLLMVFLAAGVLSPLAMHWTRYPLEHWVLGVAEEGEDGEGWLRKEDYVDFGMAGAVHVLCAVMGLVATLMVGPRQGVFSSTTGSNVAVRANPTYILLGTLSVYTSFACSIMGYVLQMRVGNEVGVSRLVMNIFASSGFAAVSGFLFSALLSRRAEADIFDTKTAILSGLVSITASAPYMQTWAAAVVGAIGAIIGILATQLVAKLKVDDASGAFGPHGACGAWSLLATAFFANGNFHGRHIEGIFAGGGARLLGIQVAGLVTIAAMGAIVTGLVLFLIDRCIASVRVPEDNEQQGLDLAQHHIFGVSRVVGNDDLDLSGYGQGSNVQCAPETMFISSQTIRELEAEAASAPLPTSVPRGGSGGGSGAARRRTSVMQQVMGKLMDSLTPQIMLEGHEIESEEGLQAQDVFGPRLSVQQGHGRLSTASAKNRLSVYSTASAVSAGAGAQRRHTALPSPRHSIVIEEADYPSHHEQTCRPM